MQFAISPPPRSSALRPRPSGFTLIELLVVVTIIAVLLALLIPAMDRAIYQAELAICGAKVHAIISGTNVYAMQYKRYLPYRAYAERGLIRPIDIQYYFPSAVPARVDDRPVLRSFLSINDTLNCPLAPKKVDLDGAGDTTNIITNYGLWFGFKYVGEKRMKKLGDKVTYAGDSYDIIAGDWSGLFDGSNETPSHNDAGPSMSSFTFEDQEIYTGVKNGPFNYTLSIWTSAKAGGRGPIDLNFGFSDGSVVRYDSVAWNDGLPGQTDQKVVQVPQWDIPSNQAIAKVQIPKR